MKKIEKIKVFFSGVRAELKKVTWPSLKELMASTGVVIIAVVIIGVFLGVADYLLQLIMIGGRYSIFQLF